ncbi:hypothetical protein ACE939_08425 [Aquimarina sp. W85]|uniref:hypothetical protein n=1 Tax=Aquimarina rhodophyticola TaxID=3342246 RepID=UPI00366E3C7B
MLDKEKKIYNLGYINGLLSSIARINDKTNHGYDFRLTKFEKNNKSKEEILNKIFNPICDSFELEKIGNPKEFLINNIIEFWFFEFQKKKFSNISLIDAKNDFSLSDDDWKKEWVEEFVNLLLFTVSSNKVFNLKVGQTKNFYVCSSSEIIFVNDQEVYHLHLSVSD